MINRLDFDFNIPLALLDRRPFTRSNGTLVSKIYERLTKASRRRDNNYEDLEPIVEYAYRRGVYDSFKALQEELDN